MFLDLKKYGFQEGDYKIDINNITSVGGPIFVESFQFESGMAGQFAGNINSLTGMPITWNLNYIPPHEKRGFGLTTRIFPHHYINIKCDGHDYQIAHANIGFKFKSFNRVDNGKIDPRLQELYDFIIHELNNRNKGDEKQTKTYEGNKDINDDIYQLYLVEKYNIKKNETLNKFVLNDKPYADLIEVLKVAHEIENENN